MARFALLPGVFLLTISTFFGFTKGGCFQESDTLRMCTPGTRSAASVFIDTNTTIYNNEECSCTLTQSTGGDVEMFPIIGSENPACTVHIDFRVEGNPIYSIMCTTDYRFNGDIAANTPVAITMTGSGRINACLNLQSTNRGSTLTVTCDQRITDRTTTSTTTTTTTQAPTTKETTQKSTTKNTDGVTTQEVVSTTKESTSSTTKGSIQSTTKGSIQSTTKGQIPSTTMMPSTLSSMGTTEVDSSSSGAIVTTTTPVRPIGSTEGFAKFPVPEVAGGVAGGILLIILLVIIITCCTSSRKKREPDEESLKSHNSQSPEMQERKEGYAFDNLLYHASQKDESGKSITPTVSDADTQDYQATKGLEELYASVNKVITDSTDIM